MLVGLGCGSAGVNAVGFRTALASAALTSWDAEAQE